MEHTKKKRNFFDWLFFQDPVKSTPAPKIIPVEQTQYEQTQYEQTQYVPATPAPVPPPVQVSPAPVPPPAPTPPPPAPAEPAQFCMKCGAKNEKMMGFCGKCGNKL
jgi:hypothetical protein